MPHAAPRAGRLSAIMHGMMAVAMALSAPTGQHTLAQASGEALDAHAATLVFERLKSLEGDWLGKSTRGWTDTASFRTIAGGSVVVQTSFDAHPGETMMTMYHLDGPRLVLTHYCVAKNQPRLVARKSSEGGRTITFGFLDATGISTRDSGHMDQAIYTFVDDDHFTSKWTWYQDGSERWLEEILYERKPRRP